MDFLDNFLTIGNLVSVIIVLLIWEILKAVIRVYGQKATTKLDEGKAELRKIGILAILIVIDVLIMYFNNELASFVNADSTTIFVFGFLLLILEFVYYLSFWSGKKS